MSDRSTRIHAGVRSRRSAALLVLLLGILTLTPAGAEYVLAFAPEPTPVPLALAFVGEQVMRVGDQALKARQYAFKPDVGPLKKLVGTLLGKLPADFHYDCYILADDVPSFVRFEGPLQLMGPILSIELISPQVAETAEDRNHGPR